MPVSQPESPQDRHSTDWTQRVQLGGLQPYSTVDWPGKRVVTVFLSGCPWRCAYCHNPELQKRGTGAALGWNDVASSIEVQRNTIDGVVFSGGEPTADRTLIEQVRWVRSRGLLVGLHTGGSYPERLRELLPLVDWVGFDLKTDYAHYDVLTGAKGSGTKATQSAKLIVQSGVAHEFRLTWHHEVLSEESALLAAHFAKHVGAQQFVMQEYQTDGVPIGALEERSTPGLSLLARIAQEFPGFEYRSANCGLAP